jgi:hypothetical protein
MQQVDLSLAPRDASGLSSLARTARSLTPAVREARRQAALPGMARAAEVAARAEKLGLTVLSTTDTDVDVAGSPALIRSLFGSARADRPSVPTAQPLPDLPPSLTGLVLVAGGGDETRPSYRPRATLSQSQFQSVFGTPSTDTTPTASSPTVATLQFSTWNPDDLTTYVQGAHVYGSNSTYDPVTGGGYSSVVVGAGPSDDSGSLEVALDQEAISIMAPGVRQRVYYANETAANAEAAAINQVAQDAASQDIVALSTSWGNCEADTYSGPNDAQLKADQAAINNVIAAGVTVFAASGDSGSDDCAGEANAGTAAVDVPAAFPNVVAVGGTTVKTGAGGTTQTAWNTSIGATGGGYSTLFSRPSYQAGIVSGTQRGVPDIAMDGDPATGLDAYASGDNGCGGNGWCAVGGTSLSAPLAAASLAAVLAGRGVTSGLGDIHSLIYACYASAFTDITSGNNGAYAAGPGWDATTGLGSPLWSSLLAAAPSAGTTPYVAITPARVVDTRGCGGRVHAGPLAQGVPYTFSLANQNVVPTGQQAYAFNVTAVAPTATGNLRIVPACGSTGTSSLVTFQPGKAVSDFVIVANPSGCNAFTLEPSGSPTNVVIDAFGYYTSGFTSVGPTRIADTRTSGGGGTVAAGTSRSFQISGNGGIPADATAVAINVTAVAPNDLGNLRVYPDGATVPNTANITYIKKQDKSAFVVVPLPADGKIDVYSDGAAVNVVLDAFGYYGSDSNLTFLSASGAPVRVLDTRPTAIAANTPYTFPVGGTNGIPADAQAVLVSVAGVHAANSTGNGNLRLYPSGAALPNAANLSYVSPSTDVANFAIVKLGTGGQLTLYSDGSPINGVLDVIGYVPAGG